ncbi:hypothetical protein GDO86_016066 [Hymenochirus boettgeri]|uniref:Uncharacterized protein n=1 Tax=Hymenochirus boettgeri TaxID=247094 RepID=A0A8T2K3N4_9PIPI|nr:hypothetical protein GDO86_016066 [Hymenochirus boettgeri]
MVTKKLKLMPLISIFTVHFFGVHQTAIQILCAHLKLILKVAFSFSKPLALVSILNRLNICSLLLLSDYKGYQYPLKAINTFS